MGNGVTKREKQKSFLLQTCDEHEGSINCMDLSEDGSVLVTGSDDANVRLWTTKTEQCECIGLLEGHEDYITSVKIEENFVLSSSADKTIKKWDMTSCECVLTFLGHDSTVNKMICTGDFLFSVSYDKTARCWDFDTGECIRKFTGHKNNITSILFIPSNNNTQNISFIKKNHSTKSKSDKNNFKVPQISNDNDETNDKDLIITGSLDSTAKSWSIESEKCVHTFRGHSSAITCLATDLLGRILFTGSGDHTIKSWDIMNGQLLKVFNGHQATVLTLIANKKLLYSTSSDHTARCWVMDFGDCTRVFKDHGHSVSCLIEINGLILTGCGDGISRCFDAKSGILKRSFKGHSGAINCLRVVSNRLFTGSFDGTLKIWDATELSAERSNLEVGNRSKSSFKGSKLTIENERETRSRSNNHSRNTFEKSDADSGFDDRDSRLAVPIRRIDVKELV